MTKLKDYTGYSNNNLTFIKRIDNDVSKALFQCICGKKKIITISNVVRGRAKSCGCISKNKNYKFIKQQLIFTKRELNDNQICKYNNAELIDVNKCFVGKYNNCTKTNIKNNTICKKDIQKDFVGFKNNKLTFCEFVLGSISKAIFCCDCGNYKIFQINTVKNGYNQDCGCTMSQLRKDRKMKKLTENYIKEMYEIIIK